MSKYWLGFSIFSVGMMILAGLFGLIFSVKAAIIAVILVIGVLAVVFGLGLVSDPPR